MLKGSFPVDLQPTDILKRDISSAYIFAANFIRAGSPASDKRRAATKGFRETLQSLGTDKDKVLSAPGGLGPIALEILGGAEVASMLEHSDPNELGVLEVIQ